MKNKIVRSFKVTEEVEGNSASEQTDKDNREEAKRAAKLIAKQKAQEQKDFLSQHGGDVGEVDEDDIEKTENILKDQFLSFFRSREKNRKKGDTGQSK